MVKTLKFIVKTIVFEGLDVCMCEHEGYQKSIKSETKIHPNIDDKSEDTSSSKKGYPKHGNKSTKIIQKEYENENNLNTKKHARNDRKKKVPAWSGTLPLGPGNTIRSKKIS